MPNLTSMTDGITSNFITTDGRSTIEFGQSLMPRMVKVGCQVVEETVATRARDTVEHVGAARV
jgi:hypothetical protein